LGIKEEGYEDVEVNGEQIRHSMEGFQQRQAWKAGVSGFAFAMGLVGIWGDGF
jgi:autophagy-related protein 33